MLQLRMARPVLGLALLWAATSALGALTADQFSGAAAVYIPVGAVAALAIRWRIPALPMFLGVLLGEALIGGITANLSGATLANSIANTIEVLVVARLMLRTGAHDFARARDVAWLALAAVLGAALGAAVGTMYGVLVNGDAAVPMFRAWFDADLLGIVLIVPGASVRDPRGAGLRGWLSGAVLLLASVGLASLAASPNNWDIEFVMFLSWYLLLLIVLLAGVRVGIQAMAVVQAPAAVAAFASLSHADPLDVMARQWLAALLALTLAGAVIGIRRQRRTEEALRQQIRLDELTGLLTRRTVIEELTMRLASDDMSPCALLVLHLDGWADLRESAGEAVADAVVQEAAQRLQGIAAPDDLLGRMHDADYVLVCDLAPDRALEALVGRARAAFVAPFDIAGALHRVGCSIGSTVSEPADTSDSLLLRANNALYLDRTMRRRNRR